MDEKTSSVNRAALGVAELTLGGGMGRLQRRAQRGSIARVPDDAMAFTGRQAPFWLVEVPWEDPALDDAHIGWGRSAMDALKPFTAAHYVNDMVESGDDVVRGIYGAEKYERLVELKRAYDPDNVFRLNQNILPS